MIKRNFNIINCTNERFEYNANNITIELKESIFKNFRCEIQLVTVMSHNLIEIGHDIFYKDLDNLKRKDEVEYEELKKEYKKCIESVYKLETRIETLKRRKNNILESYKILNEIISDEFINMIDKNKSTSKFYDICNDIISIAAYLSRNVNKIKEFEKKKIILKLTKNLFEIETNDFVFTEDFVFENYLKVLTTYYNVWINDSNEILDLLISYIELKKNPRIEKDFFDAIKTIINLDIKNKKWIMFLEIKKWILKNKEKAYYKIKMANIIIRNNIEYMEPVNSKTFNFTRKEIVYNEKGKKLLKEVYIFVCNLFLENQKNNIYNELIALTYNFDFFVNDILEFFYDNYEKIHDIYRYDLLRKIYYSFKEITLDSKYYKKIKSDDFYDKWKYLCYDYFDEYVERKNRIEISRKAQITLNRYIKNINNVGQSEIKRLVKNYTEMVNEGINIIYNYKKVLFLIGKKYNRALQIYNKNKNEYIYLGLISKGEHIEKRTDTKVLKALNNIFVGKVFNEYLKNENRRKDKDILICNIILNSNNKLYRTKKQIKNLFSIIKFYNKRKESLLNDYVYLSTDFVETISEEQCMQILNNYYICILHKKLIAGLDINLINIFKYYPKQCRDFLNQVVNNKKTRKMDFRRFFIYEAKNYEQERKNNLKLVINWLKEYDYYDINKFYYSIIKPGDKKLINDLSELVDETNNLEELTAISLLLKHIEMWKEKWIIIRKILLKSSNSEIENNLSSAMQEIGGVSSLYQAYKIRREQINDIIQSETDNKCKAFLKNLDRKIKAYMEFEELREMKIKYENEIIDEKFQNSIIERNEQ